MAMEVKILIFQVSSESNKAYVHSQLDVKEDAEQALAQLLNEGWHVVSFSSAGAGDGGHHNKYVGMVILDREVH